MKAKVEAKAKTVVKVRAEGADVEVDREAGVARVRFRTPCGPVTAVVDVVAVVPGKAGCFEAEVECPAGRLRAVRLC